MAKPSECELEMTAIPASELRKLRAELAQTRRALELACSDAMMLDPQDPRHHSERYADYMRQAEQG